MKILSMPTEVRQSLGDEVSDALLHFMTDAIEVEDDRIGDRVDKTISQVELKMAQIENRITNKLLFQTIVIILTILGMKFIT